MTQEIDTSLGLFGVVGRLAPLLFEHGAALPEGRRATLLDALTSGSPVPRVVAGMEALYGALKDGADLPEVAVVVCGQCAAAVCDSNFNNKADRAARILAACRRTLGLTADADTPPQADDPEPEAAPVSPPA